MKRKIRWFLAISLLVCLISSLGASLVQTNGGKIDYHDITMVTASGHELDAMLLVPETATADAPAPAIVVSHGWYNNREMQDLNYVEYARRGYVVMAISMYGHGDSEVIEAGTWWDDENNGNGMYDAVKYVAQLPFVNKDAIGVTGHSNGGLASRESMLQDEEGLISAALIVSNDSVYFDEAGEYANPFGSRDVGVVACQYDEFFHRVPQEDGTVSAPRDYIDQVTAQSFLYFGEDPTGLDKRESYTYYHETIDGEDAIRVIFNPDMTHPWAHFSKSVVSNSVEFFDQALGAPTPLEGTNQIWQLKAAFNALGVVGFFAFLTSLAVALTQTSYFGVLAAESSVEPYAAPTGKGRLWYWGSYIVFVIFSMLSYPLLYKWTSLNRPEFFNQPSSWYIGIWTLVCGLFTLIVLVVNYRIYGKKHGMVLGDRGVWMPMRNLWRTIVLAVVVVCAGFGLVMLSDYLFLTDYRLWCYATIRAFAPHHIPAILKYMGFWLVYYIMLSVSTNVFNFVNYGKKGWGSVLIQMAAVAMGPAIMLLVQYGTFRSTGHMWTEISGIGSSIIGIWLYPIIVMLPIAALVSNLIYRRTKNPYLGGIIMGLVACIMTTTNTLTY